MDIRGFFTKPKSAAPASSASTATSTSAQPVAPVTAAPSKFFQTGASLPSSADSVESPGLFKRKRDEAAAAAAAAALKTESSDSQLNPPPKRPGAASPAKKPVQSQASTQPTSLKSGAEGQSMVVVVGDKGVVEGLVQAAAHNGKSCVVTALNAETGRVRVRLEGGNLEIDVKPVNFRLVTEQKGSANSQPPSRPLPSSMSGSSSAKSPVKPKATAPPASKGKKRTISSSDDDEAMVAPAPAKVAASPAKQEDGEEKKPRSNYFTSVLSREPPAEKGMHPLPVGKHGCLNDLTFVTSGVLRSLESEEAIDLIKRYGGRVTSAVSSKTSYLLLGKDGGKLKSEAAAKHGTKIIDEKQLFDMIAASLPPPAAPAPSTSTLSSAAVSSPAAVTAAAVSSAPSAPAVSAAAKSPVKVKPATAATPTAAIPAVASAPAVVARPPSNNGGVINGGSGGGSSSSNNNNNNNNPAAPKCSELWTTKHKPNRIEEIVGNPGKVKELQTWLMTWQRYFADDAAAKAAGDKKKKKDDNFMKAVLISGPPGIGKTTAAHIVARACAFCVLEFNASDVRSKSSLHEHVMALASNTTLAMGVSKPPAGPGAAAAAPAAAVPNGFNGKLQKRNCVIMDEVDGMSSGDRGGIAEIIKIIADCKMPIICICNDYYDAKIKSLRNHCLDMRFSKPTAIQARARLAAIARIEGLKIEPETALDKMVEISQGDMRHTLNLLQALSLRSQKISWDDVGSASKTGGKDTSSMQSSIFDTVGDWFFSSSKHTSASYSDRADMFFTDYRLMPLMVQENYIKVRPAVSRAEVEACGGDQMAAAAARCAAAADALSDLDLVDRTLMSTQSWSLLPLEACLAVSAESHIALPGFHVRGMPPSWFNGPPPPGQANMGWKFPELLGKMSTRNKRHRQLMEMHTAMQGRSSGGRMDLLTFVLPALVRSVCRPLQQKGGEGAEAAIAILDEYHLGKDDFEAMIGSGTASDPGLAFAFCKGDANNTYRQLDSKVKSAFTRQYNATSHAAAFAKTKSKASSGPSAPSMFDEDDEKALPDAAEEEDGDASDDDAFVVAKPQASAKGSAKSAASGASKSAGSAKKK